MNNSIFYGFDNLLLVYLAMIVLSKSLLPVQRMAVVVVGVFLLPVCSWGVSPGSSSLIL